MKTTKEKGGIKKIINKLLKLLKDKNYKIREKNGNKILLDSNRI